ncbi:unnamed protein product, partial [Timema podura]|nr:unnamed protein product [Timema podura]
MRKLSFEETSEEITLKKLKPAKKKMPEVKEFTEVQTVTIIPKTIKTKEDIDQEFKIQLHTYEEEDITMSGKVRLKKERPKTFAEETSEETVRILQEVEDDGPAQVEIIEEPEDEEEEVMEQVVGLKRRPKYQVEEPEDEEETVKLAGPRRPSEEFETDFKVQLRRKQEVRRTSYTVEDIEEEFQIGLKKKKPAPESVVYEEDSLALKLKPKRKPSKTLQQGIEVSTFLCEASRAEDMYAWSKCPSERELIIKEVQEVQEGDVLFSVTSYDAEIEDAIDLVEETHNTEWWYVKKHLTEEKGWAPVQLLLDENSYMLYVQKKLHEKIDKLPVFEKPPPDEKSAAPRFVEKLQPKHAPDGTTVQFECQVEGNPRPLITWFRQTAIILPSQDFQMYYDEDNVATLIIKEVFPEDAGLFTCVAKNSSGFASSTTELAVEAPLSDHGSDATVLSRKSLSRESSLADILEGIPPTFSRKPKARCVDEGTDVELECRLVAVPEPDITWYQSGEELTTGKNVTVITESDMHMYTSIVRISKVKRTQEGKYEVVARNREGEASVQITLKVRTGEKEPPQILEPLKSVIVREGDSVRLSTLIVGNPSPKITWLKDGKPLKVPTKTEGDTHTVILLHPVPGDTAEYTVTAKNEVGTAKTTATVIVEELQSLEPPMFVERFQEEKVPEKGTVRLVAKVTGNPIPEIAWLRNNEPLEPSETVTQTYDGENIVLEIKGVDSEVDAGDYKCVASNPVGKASHGARVTVDVDKVKFTKKLQPRIEVDDKSLLSLECETSHTVSTKWYHNNKELSGMDHRIVIQEG